ncbi:hypothetical protein [Paenibacillus pinihumi]|uniref:hypothetical protein n=1 Tax=Paenibacillus pinihumi TaxID=669462 RepID=UPI00040993EC|nr:hypothetical protein [Paenibacillus pinihumi]
MAMDHIGAELIKRTNGVEMILRIWNDTAFTASVAVLSEASRDTKRPLGQDHVNALPRLELEPGASIELCFHENGFQVLG